MFFGCVVVSLFFPVFWLLWFCFVFFSVYFFCKTLHPLCCWTPNLHLLLFLLLPNVESASTSELAYIPCLFQIIRALPFYCRQDIGILQAQAMPEGVQHQIGYHIFKTCIEQVDWNLIFYQVPRCTKKVKDMMFCVFVSQNHVPTNTRPPDFMCIAQPATVPFTSGISQVIDASHR